MKYSLKYIGENIRNARLAKNLTIEELAELADISDSFLGIVERGVSGISIETLRACLKSQKKWKTINKKIEKAE
jgi:transcriptional regulator with XRE-family HTH domain